MMASAILRRLPSWHRSRPAFCTRFVVKKFLSENKLDKAEGIDFAKIAAHGSDKLLGRVFLGLPQSGTRQAASLVLEKYGLDPEKLATNGVEDYNEIARPWLTGTSRSRFIQGRAIRR